jgi:hypothetical protein
MIPKLGPSILILAILMSHCGQTASDSDLFRPKDDSIPRVHDFNNFFDLQIMDDKGTGDKISVEGTMLTRSSQSSASFTLNKDESITFDPWTPCFTMKLAQTGTASPSLYVKSDASLTAVSAEADRFSMRHDQVKRKASFDNCRTHEPLRLFDASEFTIREWKK